jgi:hypothetical protein
MQDRKDAKRVVLSEEDHVLVRRPGAKIEHVPRSFLILDKW